MASQLAPPTLRQRSSRPLAARRAFTRTNASRRTSPPSSASASAVQWDVIDVDRYRVRRDGVTIGFIDLVGVIYVARSGARLDRAVEVAQRVNFTEALNVIAEASPPAAHPAWPLQLFAGMRTRH